MQHNDGLGLFDAVKQFFGTGFEPQDIIGQYVRVASRNYHVDACTTIKTVSVIDIFSQMKGLGTQWTLCFGIEPFVSYGAYELKTSVTENKVEHVEASITQYEFSTLLLSWPENIWTLWGVPFPVTNAMQVHDLLMIKYNDEFPASEKIRDAAKKNLPFKVDILTDVIFLRKKKKPRFVSCPKCGVPIHLPGEDTYTTCSNCKKQFLL
tara:strand:- start:746 stop:1369 length:624 start_codon:yes stop_codon:yes gene_type:complete